MTAPAVLTVEQIAELASLADEGFEPGTTIYVTHGGQAAAERLLKAVPALLETARAYHRLTGAIAFRLDQTPEEFVDDARDMGWSETK